MRESNMLTNTKVLLHASLKMLKLSLPVMIEYLSNGLYLLGRPMKRGGPQDQGYPWSTHGHATPWVYTRQDGPSQELDYSRKESEHKAMNNLSSKKEEPVNSK